MQAVVVRRTGGPEVLELEQGPTPEPGPGELRVDVVASGVNFIDIYQRSGVYPMPMPHITGSEGAGVVSAVGPGVAGSPADFSVGARVAWAGVPGGGYASQVLVPAVRAVPVPLDTDLAVAAAVMLQGITAHYLSESTYRVEPGDDVLVHAAAGGVGLLLTQLVTLRGGRVLATTSTDEKAALARRAGAAEVIDYTTADVAQEVRRLTDGRGVAVVYDGVGRSTFDGSLSSLRPRGLLALFGAASGAVPPFDPQLLNSKGSLFLTRPSMGHYIATREELLDRAGTVLRLVGEGRLDVRIGARYSITDAAQAQQDLADRRTTGKSIVLPE